MKTVPIKERDDTQTRRLGQERNAGWGQITARRFSTASACPEVCRLSHNVDFMKAKVPLAAIGEIMFQGFLDGLEGDFFPGDF